MDVGAWLGELGLEQYADSFVENHVDAETLAGLGNDDLKDIGVASVGHRKKLLAAIADLSVDSDAAPAAAKAPSPAAQAERRQVTIMFVDLVGSTALSGRLDPEDLRHVMRRYQDAASGAITHYGGHVAKFLGDGILAYFGWPQAHEDQAEHAVHAGLDAVEAVRGVSADGGALQARVGIATGEVVIGDIVGEAGSESGAVAGETPNLAARLQGVAKPDQVVIGAATRRLIGESFILEDLGRQKLKGIKGQVPAWRVSGARVAASRFEAVHTGALTAFVGRDEEVDLLLKRWDQAKAGEGQVVLLSGEAGIGKSRIIQTLRERIADEPYTRLRYQCSPYHGSTAFHPFIDQLEHAAGIKAGDTPEAKLDKIEKMLAHSTDSVSEAAPLFAELLSVPAGDRYEQVDLGPERRKEKTLEQLTDQLLGLAAKQPVVINFEDVQWVDPTSLESLAQMVDRIQGARVLAIITFRPEFTPPWGGHSHVTALTLNRLGQNQCGAIVASVTAGKTLPNEVLDQIIDKTDGVPLFVEELTKTVLESGLLEEKSDRYELSGPLPPLAIPSTLQDSLMARLDRLDRVKQVAQIGAAIGREFPYRLLAAVSTLGAAELQKSVDQLVASDMVFRRGSGANVSYVFKHALVQDTAYASLLKSSRQQHHGRIGRALEKEFPEIVETQPEIVAHHFTEAGLAEAAVSYWDRAGRRATERSANPEAITHLSKGMELIPSLPESPERDKQELALLNAIGPPLMMTKGVVSRAVEEVYAKACELAQRVGDRKEHFTSLWGHYFVFEIRAQWTQALDNVAELLVLARDQDDTGMILQAHHAAWTAHTFHGNFTEARKHAEQGRKLYDADEHAAHKFRYGGHDPGVCARSVGGNALLISGYPDQALASADEGASMAKELAHPASEATARFFCATVRLHRGDVEGAGEFIDTATALANEHNNDGVGKMAMIVQGRVLAAQGRGPEGIAQIEAVLAPSRAKKRYAFMGTYYLSLLAEAYAGEGLYDESLQALADGLDIVESQNERFWEAEMYRLKGGLLLARSAKNQSDAEASFNKAIEIARAQEAKFMELRAATSLARLWGENKKRAEASDLLTPVFGWFTEGFETADLKAAKALLAELS